MRLVKIALVGPYPAGSCLDPSQLRPSRRSRIFHPVPWIRLLCKGLALQPEIETALFVHSRDVATMQKGTLCDVPCWFVPKLEPGNFDPILGSLTARIQMRPLIRRFNPDVVLGFGTESMYGLLASKFGVPSVVFIQGIVEKIPLDAYGISAWAHPFLRRMERRAMERATAVIAENNFAADWARSLNPKIKVSVIPHPVSPEFLNISSDYNPRILFIGVLNSNKRPDMVIRAFSAIALKYPHAELVIVGAPGDLSSVLPSMVKEAILSGRVRLTGPLTRDEVMKELAGARCLVLASRMDTSPNVITEAHAAGLPVIATRVGGVPEMVDDGVDGFLIDVDDEVAMTERMEWLLEDRDLAVRLGSAGRRRVQQSGNLTETSATYLKFFRELLVSRSQD